MGGAILCGQAIHGLAGWIRYSPPRVAAFSFTLSALGTFLLAGARSLPVGIRRRAHRLWMGGKGDGTPICSPDTSALNRSLTLYGFTWTGIHRRAQSALSSMGAALTPPDLIVGFLCDSAGPWTLPPGLMLLFAALRSFDFKVLAHRRIVRPQGRGVGFANQGASPFLAQACRPRRERVAAIPRVGAL